jgi:dTDP-4-dehydrorhamnose reductase
MSLIGREPAGSRLGLVEWFLGAEGTVRGFSRAVFTGLTTPVAARLIAALLRDHPDLQGLWHVAAAPVTKYDLLLGLRDRTRPGLPIQASDTPVVDRRLDGGAFARRTGWVAPGWDSMLDEILGAT